MLEPPIQCQIEMTRVDILTLLQMLRESIQSFTNRYNVSSWFFHRYSLCGWKSSFLFLICWIFVSWMKFYIEKSLYFTQYVAHWCSMIYWMTESGIKYNLPKKRSCFLTYSRKIQILHYSDNSEDILMKKIYIKLNPIVILLFFFFLKKKSSVYSQLKYSKIRGDCCLVTKSCRTLLRPHGL